MQPINIKRLTGSDRKEMIIWLLAQKPKKWPHYSRKYEPSGPLHSIQTSVVKSYANTTKKKGTILCHSFFNYNLLYGELWVFWVNIVKFEVNLCYRNCLNLFGILRREIKFRYYRCRNWTKSMREKKKKVERENVEFRQRWYRISSAQFCCQCVECPKWKEKKKIDKRIMALLLPK